MYTAQICARALIVAHERVHTRPHHLNHLGAGELKAVVQPVQHGKVLLFTLLVERVVGRDQLGKRDNQRYNLLLYARADGSVIVYNLAAVRVVVIAREHIIERHAVRSNYTRAKQIGRASCRERV